MGIGKTNMEEKFKRIEKKRSSSKEKGEGIDCSLKFC